MFVPRVSMIQKISNAVILRQTVQKISKVQYCTVLYNTVLCWTLYMTQYSLWSDKENVCLQFGPPNDRKKEVPGHCCLRVWLHVLFLDSLSSHSPSFPSNLIIRTDTIQNVTSFNIVSVKEENGQCHEQTLSRHFCPLLVSSTGIFSVCGRQIARFSVEDRRRWAAV
jgi:hypothetical protein